MTKVKLSLLKGGEGSGNFAHAGRLGKVGGSAPGTGGVREGKVTKAGVLNLFQGTNINETDKHPFKGKRGTVFKLTNNADVRLWRRLSNMGFSTKLKPGMFGERSNAWFHPKSDVVVQFVKGEKRGVKYAKVLTVSKLQQAAGDTLADQLGALARAESKKEYNIVTKLKVKLKGGPGSGHHGHAGRPGKVGGSTPSGGGGASLPKDYRDYDKVRKNEGAAVDGLILLTNAIASTVKSTGEISNLKYKKYKAGFRLEDKGGFFGHMETSIGNDELKKFGFTSDTFLSFLTKHGASKIGRRKRAQHYVHYD
jgi:hypothetical protein